VTPQNEDSTHISSNLYSQIMRLLPIVSVEAVIVMDGSLLFLKRKNQPVQGQWWFPGGRIHLGESFEQTLHREVKEETGLRIISYKFIGAYSRIFPERHDVTLAYLCNCEGSVELDKEHSDYKFSTEIPKGLHLYLLALIKDSGVEKILSKKNR
jgi:ADP-ribose pyrophosphatase YjhB (NUDIX family)